MVTMYENARFYVNLFTELMQHRITTTSIVKRNVYDKIIFSVRSSKTFFPSLYHIFLNVFTGKMYFFSTVCTIYIG